MSEMDRKEALFASAPVGRAVASLAVPTVIAQLITVVYNMADTFFIGRLGDPNQVAAATLAMPVFMLLTAFANLFGIGGASLISRCLGAGDRDKARQTAAFCIWTAGAVALCYGVAVVVLQNRLLPLLGTDAQTTGFCASYLFWTVGVGAVPTVLNATLAHLVRAEGYAGRASFGVACGGVLNMLLDPLFIFAFRGEIAGAAVATMLSNVVATGYFLLCLFRMRRTAVVTLSPACFTLRRGIPREVVTVGLPGFVMTLMSSFSNLTLNKIIAGYSNEAVAGMGIAKKIDLLAFAIAQGMTQGALPLIGYNYSAGNRRRMFAALRVLLVDCLVISLAGTVLMWTAATPITRCFIDNEATVAYGRDFLRIVCLACPTTALNFLAITLFQATGRKGRPLVLSLLRKGGLDIPLMPVLEHAVGIRGIAWATPLADAAALLVSVALVVPYLRRMPTKAPRD